MHIRSKYSTVTYAQEKRYPIGNSTNVLSNFRRQLATARSNDINRLQLQLSSIRDENGIVVYSASHIQTGQQINITSLIAGLYFITINTGKETITQKLIKR